MKFYVLLVFASYSLFVSAQQTEVSSRNSNPDPVYDQLVWSDDFEGSGAINTDKWFHQTRLPNGNSWYNGEIQHYTNRTENTSVC